MLLYRSISLIELVKLFRDKKVDPTFEFENEDSTYRKELGAVTCWFTEAYSLPNHHGYDFVVVADISESEIVGFGKGTYTRKIAYDMGANEDIWTDIFKLEQRYRRFCHYIKEVKPQWQTVSTADFADNSVELIQENIFGEQRRIMVKAPSGDICF